MKIITNTLTSLLSVAALNGAITTQVSLTANPADANTLEGTSSAGNAITLHTTDSDPAPWASFNYNNVTNPEYIGLFGAGTISNPHPETDGGNSTITVTNNNAVSEFTYLLIYDIDFSSDSIQFTSGSPTFYGSIGAIDTSETPSVHNWDAGTQILSGGGSPVNTNVAIFDITGVNTVVFDDTTSNSGRSFNVGIYTSTVPIPEPSSAALLGLGGLALISRRRRS